MRKSLLLLVSSLACAASQFDCNAGCSLDASLMGGPVCADDLTYANACIAYCQGITQYTYGTCGEGFDESRIAGFPSSGDAEVITLDVMNRFAHESFHFITKRTQFASQLDNYENVSESDLVESLTATPRRHFLRITSEGYEFMAPIDSTSSSAPSSAGHEGLGDGSRKLLRERNLIIIGTDTRQFWGWGMHIDIYFAHVRVDRWPLRVAKEYERAAADDKGSTGSICDPSTGSVIDPFGTWEVDYMTTFQEFKDLGSEAFDMAVVTFKPSNRPDLGCSEVYPGDVVGYLGMDRVAGTSLAVNDPRLTTMTVTGYPSDYKMGSMVTSGLCSRPPNSGGPHYIWHYCDTVAGMSGSAYLTSDNVILGNHAHGNWVSSKNGGPALNSALYDAVYNWAGLSNQKAFVCSASNVCPCTSMTNPSQRALCWFVNFKGCFRAALDNRN